MELDPVLLSRMQFAFVVSFHAIFPVFTIGLASYIAVLEGIFYRTANPEWQRLSMFWTKVFAVVFGMGVVSGIVMSFQFGTNWSSFAQAAANFMGPVLSYEVITAFFLEAAFLGVLLFGRDKVPPGTHLFAAVMVALGTFVSSFWILATNSWMQTPDGVMYFSGMYQVTSWTEAIFNPSFPYRFGHFALASFLTGGFVVAGVSAYYLLNNRAVSANKKALSMCMWMLLIAAPAQLVVGDMHGLNTLKHQPTKVAAMEGNWERQSGAPLLLFAIPDQANQTNHYELGIPGLASYLLKHDFEGEVPGVSEVPRAEQPPVAIVFWSFRVMVGLGVLMIGFVIAGLVLRLRGTLYSNRFFLQGLRAMAVAPFVAVLAGWIVTEVGRAPWLIYGEMTHSEGVTPSLTGGMALFTLIGYVLVYAVIFVAGLYYITRVVQAGLEGEVTADVEDEADRPMRPLSAAHTAFDTETPETGK